MSPNRHSLILFSGQYWPGANTLYMARAFEQEGCVVKFLNDTAFWPDWTTPPGRVARRLLRRLVIEHDWNRRLVALARATVPDLVYVSNADFCWASTLDELRALRVPTVCFYHDVRWRTHERHFAETIAYWDLVATTRDWQIPEFRAAGARATIKIRFGFDPSAHMPVRLSGRLAERFGAPLTFIGTMESHRCHELHELAKGGELGQFKLWGSWGRLVPDSPLRQFWQGRDVTESEIAAIYSSSQVALHWVGHDPNGHDPQMQRGDQHNSRTFQIPACGGAIMLAQRTREHQAFFAEDAEAVFFGSLDELRDKIRYWIAPAASAARTRMALAARRRCEAEDYSYRPVVRSLLAHFNI